MKNNGTIPWKIYKSKLPTAYKIYDKLFGKPKTNRDWAEGFNIRDKILRILLEDDKSIK